ncbi:MAG: N-acetylmuramoyl-L-alanine amidase [Ruminococcaceae bacterium]|nr:N-acetylmuramoyl-L-alanine amidase [Oscillospiraceae bacterium]
MNIYKRFSVLFFSFLFFVTSMGCIDKKVAISSAKSSLSKTIIIDAGHGGFDGGAVASDGTAEKDINLNIALHLGEMLSIDGYNVIYTRTIDTGTEENSDASISSRKKSDLHNRLKLMEQYPDSIFVSVHLNKFTSGYAKGAQVFYSPNFDESREYSISVQNSIKELLQPENERVVKKATKSAFLLYNAKVPAIIVECGFLSNKSELQLLKNENYQKQLAFAIYNGIIKEKNR